MTYLSRVRINPLRAASRTLLANPRALHGAVMAGIPDASPDDRVLWRLDGDHPRRPMLLALTPTKPDWTHIVEQAGWPDADGEHYAVRDYHPLLAQLATGREFAFRLTASPVQNTSTPDKSSPHRTKTAADLHHRSFRVPHRTAAQQLTWFLERTPRWGFDIPPARTDTPAPGLEPDTADTQPAREVRITDRNRHSFSKPGSRTPVTLTTATFEGRLRITDPHLFQTSLLAGIGPSKAYGCGLLTLAPLSPREA
ncbi:type I-E CRISPR-associated protein Cas6/Cse3/CasE [Kitasatospora herbaricolor]|uniref:Type I-E CRISPR-associated protein Cas6/Cse3/CasE n=1 Tax=Kitasatospora herbaricolor TaxID=68217 RepID=A0ABZ1W0I4_9ACTN|nr:type I-E CRISPR-associated protein Cas6/Cse3/CasE [Kitasatospora herbaricolor]